MKKIPKRIWVSAGLATVFGIIIILLSKFMPHTENSFPWGEVSRDVGIAFIVAGIISIIYEWSTRTTEKKIEMKSILDESLSTFIPNVVWNEVKTEVLLRKVFRSNMELRLKVLEGEFKFDDKADSIKIPEDKIVLKTILSYNLYGISTGNSNVDVKHHLDQHMRNNDMRLPCFTSATIKGGENESKIYIGDELAALVDSRTGCLSLSGKNNVKTSYLNQTNPTVICIERYEIVNVPGLYTMVMPEMVIPMSNDIASHKKPTVNIILENEIKKGIEMSIETWFNSPNHKFEKNASGNEWQFKSVILPGQGFSLIFSIK